MKKEIVKKYAQMAKESSRDMGTCLRNYLESLAKESESFRSKYDAERVKDAIKYVIDCSREILNGKSGEVADEVCYKIARDYFEDEIWKEEPEKPAKKAKKESGDTVTASVDDVDDVDEDHTNLNSSAPKKAHRDESIPEQLSLFGDEA